MSTEFTYTQEIKLPSQGLLNPEIPEGKLTQRCMMVKDQKFLSGSSQSSNSALHQLLQDTTISPEGFDVEKLTLSDTLYLLFKLRILSYGEDYKFRARCPECGKKIDVTVNLADIPVDILEEDYEEKLVVELPHRKDKVYTKLLSNQEIKSVNEEIKRRKKRTPNDESSYILRIARSVSKIELVNPDVNGKKELTSFFEIERYISSLTDLDASVIINASDDIHYGIRPTVEYVCPECNEYIDINIQFSASFFRPTISR